ncbi:ATP/GTP-binding protein [Streptomyces sp. NPDC093097]|uniref:ATP/GTP-binding protein n=1 Tax=Streptomyces sp. NPDC093097 TaxID=3366027 RepID=UPI00381F3434
MLRRAAAAALLLAGVCTPVAYADEKGSGVCDTSGLLVTVCAEDGSNSAGEAGKGDDKPASTTDRGSGGTSRPACTYDKADPQPPPENLAWEGHSPKDGALYRVMCPETGRIGVLFVPKGGNPAQPAVDPETVARRAVESMKLTGPDIGIVPKPSGRGLVGMPVWMWTAKSPETYGPNRASATAGATTVTATARVTQIVWTMGDGQSVTCTTAGTPYKPSYGKATSPDCGYLYRHPSNDQPGGKYTVTATSTWTIEWAGAGQSGQLTQTRQSRTAIAVGELHVLN